MQNVYFCYAITAQRKSNQRETFTDVLGGMEGNPALTDGNSKLDAFVDNIDDLAPIEERSEPRSARRFWIWGPVFLLLLSLLALLGWGLVRPSQSGPSSISTNEGPGRVAILDRPAADFALPLIESAVTESMDDLTEFQLEDYRGKTVVLNFWASWCGPCRVEAPALEQAWQIHQNEDVVFVGINTWDSRENAQIFMSEYGITFPNALDEPGTTAVEYGMMGIPETYFITPDGKISRKIIGGVTVESIGMAIAEAQEAVSNQ